MVFRSTSLSSPTSLSSCWRAKRRSARIWGFIGVFVIECDPFIKSVLFNWLTRRLLQDMHATAHRVLRFLRDYHEGLGANPSPSNANTPAGFQGNGRKDGGANEEPPHSTPLHRFSPRLCRL